jgi:hypothetical protein
MGLDDWVSLRTKPGDSDVSKTNWTVSLPVSYDLLLTEIRGFCYDFVAA